MAISKMHKIKPPGTNLWIPQMQPKWHMCRRSQTPFTRAWCEDDVSLEQPPTSLQSYL